MTWALRFLVGPLLSAHLLTTSKLEVVWPAAIVRPPGAAPLGVPFPCRYIPADANSGLCIGRSRADRRGLGGPSATNKRHRVYTGALLATMVTPPKKGGRSPYAAAHTQATMGGNRTDEALLELSTLVLANCQPALPLRRSICAG